MLSCNFWFSVVGRVCRPLRFLTSGAFFSSLGWTRAVTIPDSVPGKVGGLPPTAAGTDRPSVPRSVNI